MTARAKKKPVIRSRDVSAFLVDKLTEAGRVILPGLGTLHLAPRAGRTVRHPKTGELYEIPPRVTLVFRRAKPRKRGGE